VPIFKKEKGFLCNRLELKNRNEQASLQAKNES